MDAPAQTPLAAFLAHRDEPCPGCGYNLRGVTGSDCPECGRPITLSIARPVGRPLLALLLVLVGWVAVASGLGVAAAAREARFEAQSPPAFRLTVNGQPIRIPTRATNTVRASGGVVISGQAVSISTRAGPVGGVRSLAAPASRGWRAVSWQTWLRLGWAAVLTLGATVLVWILIAHRREIAAEGPGRGLWIATGLVLAVFAGGHAADLIRAAIG